MRIAIDIQGIQSIGSRRRGIGRYSRELITNMINEYSDNEYVLVANSSLMDIRSDFEVELKKDYVTYASWFSPNPLSYISQNENVISIGKSLRTYAFSQLKADLILITSFFEGFVDDCLIELDRDLLNIPIITIFYDLIPLLNPKLYLETNQSFSQFYYDKIENLKSLDGLLAISSSSAKEATKYLNFDRTRVHNISSACDFDIFNEEIDQDFLSESKQINDLKPFILYTGANDPRKNLKRLFEAYSLLPFDILLDYKLVLAGKLLDLELDQISKWIEIFNIDQEKVICLGYVTDQMLVNLYQQCSLFVFPSLHEGFGLPVLEAMSCGAPAIGSNCTSIKEVINSKEAMFDPNNVNDIKDLIQKALIDLDYQEFLRSNAKVQIKKFSWSNTSLLAIEACKKYINFSHDLNNVSDIESSNDNSQLVYKRLIDNLSRMKTFTLGRDSNLSFINLIAASIDLIDIEIKNVVRFFSRIDTIEWKVEGPFDSSYSLAILNRCFVRALYNSDINISINISEGHGDYSPDLHYLQQDSLIYSIYKSSKNSTKNFNVVSRNMYPPRVSDLNYLTNIMHSYGWEESEFPSKWVDDFNLYLQGISVMSLQVKKILIDNGVKIPIHVSSLGLDHIRKVVADENYLARDSKFRFLHISSCFPRKGVDILLKAYGSTFTSNDKVILVIKTFRNIHNNITDLINNYRNRNPLYPEVLVIYDELDSDKLKSLYLNSDVLVCPSRGEGFGLPIGEAMCLGLPVITTAWGGQTDFCTDKNSWLIDYEFAPAKTHFSLFSSYWAEPSCEHLSALMKKLFNMNKLELISKTELAKKQTMNLTWTKVAEKNINLVKTISSNNFSKPNNIGVVTTWNSKCGISSYSKHLIDNMPRKITIFSPITNSNDSTKDSRVIPCWKTITDEDQDLAELYKEIINNNIRTLLIQFNYGFFSFEQFSELLNKLFESNVKVIIIMHSTQDPIDSSGKNLSKIVNTLKFCNRILVHSISDLNRLKNIGLINNVSFFPHGILDFEPNTNLLRKNILNIIPLKSNKKKIASYGFCLPNKGFKELIHAIKILDDRNLKVELNIYSSIYSDDYLYFYHELLDLVNCLGVNDIVKIIPDYFDDQESLNHLASHDLIVFPYRESRESSSASVRHGLASLQPVIVTPSSIFEDLSGFVQYFSGFSAHNIADGIIEHFNNSYTQNSQHIDQNNLKKLEFINAHRFSRVGRRLLNIIDSLNINYS